MILNVAEKPSVAKEVTIILSQNRFTSQRSESQYNPIYQFDMNFQGNMSKMCFTSVSGHMMNFKFPNQYHNWRSIDPVILLKEAPVNKAVAEDKTKLADNLRNLAARASVLVLWLDCDAEGEAISYEVIEICEQVNNRMTILRAQFSAVTKQDIERAVNNLHPPNKRLAESIEARQEIDLRIGASFTRFQTLTLQPRFASLNSSLISYGPCQIPTLGFVVERFKKVRSFIPENFWYIFCKYERRMNSSNLNESIELNWNRGHLFDKYMASVLYEKCLMNPYARIKRVETKAKSKWRPLPLSTIELQKIGTRKLHISSSRLMEIAEKLYNKGYISYPRTETDSFLKSINLKDLIGYQSESNEWGSYVSSILTEGHSNSFLWPRNGTHNDNAHPPIHPVKYLNKNSEFSNEEYKVYELITRHFLGACSQDARGKETSIEIEIADEGFTAKGLLITEYNYLTVYIYDKWSETTLPSLNQNEFFLPTEFCLREGKTTAPLLLSETDLISTMDKNGIGTDATIHEHIKTIQERGYAEKNNGFFSPTNLGLALVESYEQMGLELAQPKLRAEMERKMKGIVEGRLTKDQVVEESIDAMHIVYLQVSSQKNVFIENIRRFFTEANQNQNSNQNQENTQMEMESENSRINLGKCKNCQLPLKLISLNFSRALQCDQCGIMMNIPKNGDLSLNENICPLCGCQVVTIKSANNSNYFLCPWCYNNPPSDFTNESGDNNGIQPTMPCFKCTNRECSLANGWLNKKLFDCVKCRRNGIIIKKTKKNTYFCSCQNYPNCKNSAFLPDIITEVFPSSVKCSKCNQKNISSIMVELKFREPSNKMMSLQMRIDTEEKPLFCLVPECDYDLQEMGYKYSKEINRNNNNNTTHYNNLPHNENSNANRVIKCFKCNQIGHISPNCPNNGQNKPNFNTGSFNNNEGSTNFTNQQVFKCFKCDRIGHMANQCTFAGKENKTLKNNNNNYNQNKKNNNYSNNYQPKTNNFENNKIKCFKCNQVGHIAPNCPKQDKNSNFKKREYKENKKKKTCNFCGVQGKHPRGSTCQGIKRRGGKKSKNQQFHDNNSSDESF